MNSPVFIIIDGSFYCYHHFFSVKKQFTTKNSRSFMEQYKTSFVDQLLHLKKGLNNPVLIIGKDCTRAHIWRHDLFDKYKATRKQVPEVRPFIQLAYHELFQRAGANKIISHPRLEADDCIALYVSHLVHLYPLCRIIIMTGDKDYVQLQCENVKILTWTYKELTGNPLQVKILMGDKSDNIPSVFPQCGIKTATRCMNDIHYFAQKMNNNKQYYDQYTLNTKLMDFHHIPTKYKREFLDSIS